SVGCGGFCFVVVAFFCHGITLVVTVTSIIATATIANASNSETKTKEFERSFATTTRMLP
ncbi:MAG: hypothetical protein RR818_10250, partial [Citrobacter sp.]